MTDKPSELYKKTDGGGLQLLGQRCRNCGTIAFPRQPYGCETCGIEASESDPVEMEAKGRVLSWAVVNFYRNKTLDEPFVVGEIRLSEGMAVRALLDCDPARADLAGTRVSAEIRPLEIPGKPPKEEICFVAEGDPS